MEQVKPLLIQKRFAEKLLGKSGVLKTTHLRPKKPKVESRREKRLYYGAWFVFSGLDLFVLKFQSMFYGRYVAPSDYQARYLRQLETEGGVRLEDRTKEGLSARLPGPVDLMGGQQAVSQLQATRAFGQYLNEKKNYKKPNFIKHILKSQDKK